MATPFAAGRGGSPLLRTLAVGGFAAAAWFLCAGVAAADEDHSDEAAKTHDAVNVALDGQQAVDTALLLAETVPQQAAPFVSVTLEPQPFESAQSFESSSITGVETSAVETSVVEFAGADVLDYRLPTVVAEPEADRHPSDSDTSSDPYPGSDAYSDTGGHSYSGYPAGTGGHSASGGYSNGYSHSGTVSNTMPAPLYEAKVAAKAAAREAAIQAATPESPPAVHVTAPTRATALPFAPSTEPDTSQVTPSTDVIWEVPEPSAPAPTPKQAPAPSAPTASSGSASDGGGGHRGGLIASLTGQADLKPSAAWSVERWDDGRSPGSVPGLPSTSPD
ncbi:MULTISPECIES: hypothetical protein [Saccharothrix]|uniref:hypothetical protein n=1 Tax=Saccharothrix TaxID=2071 RepID=UPI000939D501|nr:hypothetical protein [Saccharothrix sp. CB00851]OKI39110.1 hypothetical protein A6A25_02730 [Saccharothrix sp. CB00851]